MTCFLLRTSSFSFYTEEISVVMEPKTLLLDATIMGSCSFYWWVRDSPRRLIFPKSSHGKIRIREILAWGSRVLANRTLLPVPNVVTIIEHRYKNEDLDAYVRLLRCAVGPDFIFKESKASQNDLTFLRFLKMTILQYELLPWCVG